MIRSYRYSELNQEILNNLVENWDLLIPDERSFNNLGVLQKELVYHECMRFYEQDEEVV